MTVTSTEPAAASGTMNIVRRRLETLLAPEVLDDLLDTIADDLDAAGIRAVHSPTLEALLTRHHIYRTSLAQLGHAIDTALAEPVDTGDEP